MDHHYERRLERLIDHLPTWMAPRVRWLRRPQARWVRMPSGVLLVIGGVFSFLPVLGIWMLPLGLVLLADDIRPLRRANHRVLDWLERRRPHWFAAKEAGLSAAERP